MLTVYTERHRQHATDLAVIDGKVWDGLERPVRGEMLRDVIEAGGFGPIVGPQDAGLGPILAVHDQDYVQFLQTAMEGQATAIHQVVPLLPEVFIPDRPLYHSAAPQARVGLYAFDRYAPILPGTFDAVYWAAQCAVTAADAVVAGEGVAYALCRPPGHHASNRCGGFCYLNNVAIAARRIQSRAPGCVAVLDIDVHHGNGTQVLFYHDPSVLYCSIHGHPNWLYPYSTGGENERGEGDGAGFNHNWPLACGADGLVFLRALEEALTVIADYVPAALLVSLGFDTATGDPYGGFRLSTSDFGAVGRRLCEVALPLLLVQEGGYGLDGNGRAPLSENAQAFFQGLLERGDLTC